MLRFNYLVIVIALFILILLSYFLKKKLNKPNIYLTFFCIFFVYLMYVFKYAFFPIPFATTMGEIIKEQSTFFANVNYIPFKYVSKEYLLSVQAWGNIFLSIPFGFGIFFLFNIRKKIIKYALMFGVTIESVQLLISFLLGYTYRTIDINDVIFNFVGVIIGYYLFRIFKCIFIRVVESRNFNLDAFSKYIYEVAKNSFE